VKAIIVTDRTAGIAGMRLVDRPDPDAARLASLDGASYGDVVVEVHASGFTGNELDWPSTWTDREGRDRSPTIPGHEVAGIVTALSYGAAGLAVGQRVFGLTDWTRDGSLAEYAVVEARNLAPLAGDVDFVTGAGVAMTGLTAWQGLFEHGRLTAGQTVLVHGVAGAVGSMAAQLARDAGAYVVGTGRASHRLAALDFGANEFLDLENDDLDDAAGVDLVFDVFGGDIGRRSVALVRPGGTFVTVAGPPEGRPTDARSVDFVVVSDRAQLTEIAHRVRTGRVRPHIVRVAELADAASALDPATRAAGKTVIRIRP
jgi:NADPH:quinone reductase-like Zn-dependent oxidoreductase